MPSPIPTNLPADYGTFELPPSMFGLAEQAHGGRPTLEQFGSWLAIWHEERGASAASDAAQAAGQPAEPSQPGAWSPEPAEIAYRERPASADTRLSAMESWDLGPSGHAWARQELDSMDTHHTVQAGGQDPAAVPYYLTRLFLLQNAIASGRQPEPGATRAANAADAAEEAVEIAHVPEPDLPAAPAVAEVVEVAASPDAFDAPMAFDAPITLEAVRLDDAPEAGLTPVAGLLGAMALIGLVGLHPEGDISGL